MIPGASIHDWVPAPLPEPTPKRSSAPRMRSYVAARIGGENVLASLQSKDAELRRDLAAMVRNSRTIHNNNPFLRRYSRTLGTQVVGPHGVRLQSKAPGSNATKIEQAWVRWGQRSTCCVDGRASLPQLCRNYLRTCAIDGECFIRIVRGASNAWGFGLQMLDADLLDRGFNDPVRNIVMGVELDVFGRPVAYHFSDPKTQSTAYNRGQKIRIPASEIIHGFDPERAATQTRGVPWASSSMYLLDMLGHYWESEVAAARHEAERPGFITTSTDTGEEANGVTPTEGDEAAPGPSGGEVAASMPGTLEWRHIPAGYDVKIPDLQHPAQAFGDFSKAMLKGIASGLGISYASLSSDLTEVSFASIRQGVLEDRDWYRELQQELIIQTLLERVFLAWYDMALVSGQLVLDGRVSYENATAHTWAPRGWGWVDPKADSTANETNLRNGTTSRTRICAAQGEDVADVLTELEWEAREIERRGIVPPPPKAAKEPLEKEEPADADA